MTFDPNEKRDETGKWTKDGSGLPPLTLPEFNGVGSMEFVRERADTIAKDMGFDPKRIDISEDKPTFELNGKQYNTGGIAETNKPEGEGRIVIYRQNIVASALDGVIVHEIEHMKFQTVLNRYATESSAVGKEPGPAPDPEHKYYWGRNGGPDAVMAPDGHLRGDYAAKYPVYSGMQEAFYKHGAQAFGKTDGVTPYSYDWWSAFQDGKTGSYQAVHETLAEMARVKRTTGSFPDHMGHHVIEYRAKSNRDLINKPDFDGYVPQPSKVEVAKGTKMWRELYRVVEKLSK